MKIDQSPARNKGSLRRRSLLAMGAATLLSLFPHAYSHAGTWPARPVTLVAVTPPGGNSDTYLRLLGHALSDGNGNTVIVENRPGAGGTIAGLRVLSAEPDGHVLMGASGSSHVLYPLLAKSVPYDVRTAFVPVALIGVAPQMLLVKPDSRFQSVSDVVHAAKQSPGSITYVSPGLFGIQRLAGEMFQNRAGIKLTNVPNVRGSARLDISAGHVDMMFDSGAEDQVENGTLRALAVTSATRHSRFPNVPTMIEAGFKDYEVSSWAGIFAPKGTPPEVVREINGKIVKALARPDIAEKFESMGLRVSNYSVEEFQDFYQRDFDKWASVIQAQNLRVSE